MRKATRDPREATIVQWKATNDPKEATIVQRKATHCLTDPRKTIMELK
jgi:hypothetical protein